MDKFTEACKEIADRFIESNLSKKDIESLKREICRKKKLSRFPSNSEIMDFIEDERRRKELKIKPTRSLSGVKVIAVMTSPKECPHGKCAMCPGGPDKETPQSYTGKEPAARRADREEFNPYDQVKTRINQLQEIGHEDVEKIELIVMGGTVPARKKEYNSWFIKRCLDAMNDNESDSLEQAKKINEEARHRCIGITFETRPDYCKKPEINEMLDLGGTRVELGVQSPSNSVYREIDRGHTVEDVVESTKLLKESGLKVTYHLMPGLPTQSKKDDISSFKEVFKKEEYKPDALKIYPTQVIKGTELYESYNSGNYQPLTNEETVDLLADLKELIPPYVRIKRVMRDIPSTEVYAGPDKTNMRQLVWDEMEERNSECRCIRCREVGHKERKEGKIPDDVSLVKRKIRSSDSLEYFLSFEDKENDILIGLLRLRDLVDPFRPELTSEDAIVRELHVYGEMASLGEKSKWQHKEYGRKLLSKAEQVASKKMNATNLHVISGIGARNYYRKFDYKKNGVYMSKRLNK
ncbi:MAG: Histone acetyltransferase ELP3 [Candidatus Methanohalarchaeum thermophilum]|uniref:tRNA carboxymethyluridine synthase n=1 Tax=Methanohalarchaeum thermophilum TaxID=1903181 RepID=A0A1Q6DXR6_METT1|nr:MAG: Histone acetyltransferase ELP3 [Candidatus Methanohalarchaeum thermophilum]